jgi:hypothetical protein
MKKTPDTEVQTAVAAVFDLPTNEEMIEAAKALIDPAWRSDVVALFAKWREDKRTALARADCEEEGSWGHSTQDLKEKTGVLKSFRDGKKVLITVGSFYRHLITRMILSHPAGAPASRGRSPKTKFWLGEKSSEADI